MSFLITDAYADAASGASQGGGLMQILPMIVLLVAFMYFMVIRPQSKRAKEHKNLMSSLQAGDEVATIGGILGTIEKITDDLVALKIADGAVVTLQKSAISNVLPRGTIKGIQK